MSVFLSAWPSIYILTLFVHYHLIYYQYWLLASVESFLVHYGGRIPQQDSDLSNVSSHNKYTSVPRVFLVSRFLFSSRLGSVCHHGLSLRQSVSAVTVLFMVPA